MRFLVLGDVHGRVDRVKSVASKGRNVIGEVDAVLLTGDFGTSMSVFAELCEALAPISPGEAVGVYGNHEPRELEKLVKRGGARVSCIRILGLGEVVDVGGVSVLGISGNRGKGRRWHHWRDSQILSLLKIGRVDVVLSHEMPEGLADRNFAGKHCGQSALKRLVERLRPRLFVGGHIHHYPDAVEWKGTVVYRVGGISNLGSLSRFSFFGVVELEESIKISAMAYDSASGKILKVWGRSFGARG